MTTESERTKTIALTKIESEYLLDAFKITNPITRNLALKAAGLVLAFAAEEPVSQAEELVATCRAEQAALLAGTDTRILDVESNTS